MSLKQLLPLAIVTLIATGAAHATCTLPKGPDHIPNGSKATEEEMVSAQQAIKDYDAKTNQYTECIKSEHEATLAEKGSQMTDKEKKQLEGKLTEKHNAAIDKLQSVAERFNQEVRAFKAKKNKTQN